MKNKNYAKVFGTDKVASKVFNGEIALVIKKEKNNFYKILFDEKYYQIHEKQIELLHWQYPQEIYVRDGSLDDVNSKESKVCDPTKYGNIANYYARQGSLWIRYIISPESLILSNIEDYDEAEEKGFEYGNTVININHLKKLLRKNKIKEKEIESIINELIIDTD